MLEAGEGLTCWGSAKNTHARSAGLRAFEDLRAEAGGRRGRLPSIVAGCGRGGVGAGVRAARCRVRAGESSVPGSACCGWAKRPCLARVPEIRERREQKRREAMPGRRHPWSAPGGIHRLGGGVRSMNPGPVRVPLTAVSCEHGRKGRGLGCAGQRGSGRRRPPVLASGGRVSLSAASVPRLFTHPCVGSAVHGRGGRRIEPGKLGPVRLPQGHQVQQRARQIDPANLRFGFRRQ